MPKKSIRKMNRWERRHHSLAARTFRMVVAMAAALSIVTVLTIGGMYYNTVKNQYIETAYTVSSEAAAMLRETADVEDSVEKIVSRIHAMPEEELALKDTESWQEQFRFIESDADYQQVLSVLRFFRDHNDVEDVYLLAFDRETGRAIYIADPEEREDLYCPPGYWSAVETDQAGIFFPEKTGSIPGIVTNNQWGWMCTSGVPVTDQENSTVGYILTDLPMGDLIRNIGKNLLVFTLVLAMLTVLLAYSFVGHFKRFLIEPIIQITEAAEAYARDHRGGVEVTDHFSREVLDIRTGDEVENLSLVMADMEQELNGFEEHLTRITAEKERISTELSLATRIQTDMLPNTFPAFPERPEFDIYALMDPAREVGGDFYDFFLTDDDHLCMVMADVSGKGIPAALFMMASRILLANNAKMGKSPAEILRDTNRSICANNPEEMFVTVWLGILEISTGMLTAANAGHEYPAIRSPGGTFELYRDPHGFVLGGMDGMQYRNYELRMEPGTKLFVYTDGVPEASDDTHQMLGTERMLAALNEDAEVPPERILKNVRSAVDGFVKDAEQFDDLTMLCFEYIGQEPKGEDRL